MRRLRSVPLAVAAALLLVALDVRVASAGADGNASDAASMRVLQAGNGFLNRGMYELAAAEYGAFIAAHPDHAKTPLARYGLAVSLFRLDRYEDAVEALDPLRGRSDFDYAPAVTMILGQCELALGDAAGAARTFGAFLTEHPDDPLADEATALRAESLYRSGAWAEVAAPCRDLVTRWPDSPHRERAEFIGGLAEMARGDLAAAADRFAGVRERAPAGPYTDQATLLLARCRHRGGDLAGAAETYRIVVDEGPEAMVPEALYGLGLVRHQQEDLAGAGRRLDEFLARFPENGFAVDVRLLRGRTWFDEGRYDRAFETFESLETEAGAREDEVVYWLAKCDLRRDEPARAARRLAGGLERFPGSALVPEMTYDRAVALLRSGDPDAALDALEGFPSRWPKHDLVPDALHLLAAAEHDRARYAESTAWCAVFQGDFPDHELRGEVDFLAAENEFLRGRYEAAAETFLAFLAAHPDDGPATVAEYRLGLSLYHLERDAEAAARLVPVAAAHGDDPDFRLALFALGDMHFRAETWAEAETLLRAYLQGGGDPVAADDAWLKIGLAALRRDRPADAIVAFDALLDAHPESPHRTQARFERGQALVALGRADDAARAFETVLADAPASRFAPFARHHLGSIAQGRGQYEEAAAYFAEIDAANAPAEIAAEAAFRRGQVLLADGRLEEADRAFAGFVETYPEAADAPAGRALHAVVRARLGAHAEAREAIERVRREEGAALAPDLHAMLLYEKAWCERELDRPEAAEASYGALVEIEEAGELRLRGRLELAELEAGAERYEEASSRLRELRRELDAAADPPADIREQATYRLGVCAFRLDRFEESAETLEGFLAAYPDSPLASSASLLAGESRFRLDRHVEAAAHLQRVVDRHPDGPEYESGLLRLGECLALLQDWPRSEAMYTRARERFPDSPQWYQAQFGIGWARENQRRFDEAVPAYRKVVDRHEGPTAARAQFQVGECLFAERRHAEAVRELLKVDILYAYPEWSSAALYEAGRCFTELGDPVEARRQFERVRAEHPETDWARLAGLRLEELSRTTLPGHGGGRTDR